MTSPKKVNPRHEHAPENQSPGASGPGQQGYDGAVTVGDEGGAAGPESFLDPTGTGREMDLRPLQGTEESDEDEED